MVDNGKEPEPMPMPFQIAIDGPVAAGKGTVAKLLAERLGMLYVDTGAMYRTAALVVDRKGIDWEDADGVARVVESSEIELRRPSEDEQDGRLVTVILNGEDVSHTIRTPRIDKGSSKVSVHPSVRKVLVAKQQEIAGANDVVMEGRDIGLRVLPNAQLKIFLTASMESRAQRRYKQLQAKGIDISYKEVEKEVMERDKRDTEREADRLQVVKGAWELDTTALSIEEVVDRIEERVREMGYGKG